MLLVYHYTNRARNLIGTFTESIRLLEKADELVWQYCMQTIRVMKRADRERAALREIFPVD